MAGSPNRGVIPDVNSRDAQAPSFIDMGFDPRGPGSWGAMIRNPIAAIYANEAAKAAVASTARTQAFQLTTTKRMPTVTSFGAT